MWVTRSLDEPIRDWTYAEMWESGLAMKLTGQWDIGRRARQRGLPNDSQWKKDTLYHEAWTQGRSGEPLSIWTEGRYTGPTLFEANEVTDESAPTVGKLVSPETRETPGQIDPTDQFAPEVGKLVTPGTAAVIHPSGQKTTPAGGSIHETPPFIPTGTFTEPPVVDLVAIDFLNILVRCFHVGAPSDVHGVRGLLTTTAKILRTLKPARIVFAADGGHFHRTELLPTYKAHRPPKPPELLAQIEVAEQAIAAIGWPLIRVTGYEADDVLASLGTRNSELGTPITIVSTDKDLLQLLPRCRVWNPFGDAGGWQTAESVKAKFSCELHQLGDWLALVGDSTDGIPGAAGIGEKTATTLLAEHGDIETAVAQAALGNVRGALGTKLKSAEFLRQVELSRKLLALVDTLPVGKILADADFFPTGRPCWQHRLQELRLFGAIKPLTEAIESLSLRGSKSEPHSGAPTATRPPRAVTKSLF